MKSFCVFVIAENGTYWAAARYLEAERVDPHRTVTSVAIKDYIKRAYDHQQQNHHQPDTGTRVAKRKEDPTPTGRKRKTKTYSTTEDAARPWKRTKKSVRVAAVALMKRIVRVKIGAIEDCVYDSCAQIIKKVSSHDECRQTLHVKLSPTA